MGAAAAAYGAAATAAGAFDRLGAISAAQPAGGGFGGPPLGGAGRLDGLAAAAALARELAGRGWRCGGGGARDGAAAGRSTGGGRRSIGDGDCCFGAGGDASAAGWWTWKAEESGAS